MHRIMWTTCLVLAGVLSVSRASFGTSEYWSPPFANTAWTGKTLVVAYDTGKDIRVQAHDLTDGGVRWTRDLASASLAFSRDMCVADGLLFIATGNKGVYVLSPDKGSLAGRLRPRNPAPEHWSRLACAGKRVIVAYTGQNWLAAYGTHDLRSDWTRSLGGLQVFDMAVRGNDIVARVLDPSNGGRWKQMVIRADDGRSLTTEPATSPVYTVPERVPKPIREWFRRVVKLNPTAGPVSYHHRGRIWFVGVPAELDASGWIYAVRDSGRVVWAKTVKGFSSVTLAGDRLVAAAVCGSSSARNRVDGPVGRLFALDATSGRQRWAVDLRSPH